MRGIPAVRAGRRRLRELTPPEAPSSDLIEVPADAASAEHRERGSRFIAFVRAVSSENEARDFRTEIRRRFHDATHHVLAARLAAGAELLDDDGEPSGTGGRPVLDALAGSGLTDAAVVVTRYFGGTKLGTGPLARAYAGTGFGGTAKIGAWGQAPPPLRLRRHGRRHACARRRECGAVEGDLLRVYRA